MVLFILVECTIPERIRPRMDTFPVKGHFLSMYLPVESQKSGQSCCRWIDVHVFLTIEGEGERGKRTLNCTTGSPESQTDVLVPSHALLSWRPLSDATPDAVRREKNDVVST